ncbi:MAG TPA: magnesium-translocating P-type ATPase [Chitinophaga sp.]|uniref:magnesium-translocating P-type ATPase n=1 Tax=Chitinophaga sp. TaxID=1869181 RepID=UPI002DB5A7D1|nr:magnesium-translocating P-type ATPase [Chitinophaga sp.]HEU4552521.1 magnesium-translocating P-type ATPase [Chitinophaga sp.]
MLTEAEGGYFSAAPVAQLYVRLKCSEKGLTAEEAAERLRQQHKISRTESRFKKELKLLLRQFFNPLVLLLVVAVVLSAFLRESSDAYIILFILFITGLLGFWQEVNAGRAFDQLKKMIETKHTVLRNSKIVAVETSGIVIGDVLTLIAGDIIPADCRIVESNELHVNESTLTGESYPVEKRAGEVTDVLPLAQKYNCLWQGTNVISGTAKALVVQTGSKTLFGQMAHSLTQTPETAFEKGIRQFGFFLLRITIILALVILLANLYFRKPLFDAVLFSLALAIGMAPELLPAIMTFAMSAGARRMMKKKVIVKKLSSIFNFGEMNVLCTDKTGTITEGNVTVKDIVDVYGISSSSVRRYAWLNAFFQDGFPNPVDKAIGALNIALNGYEKINEVPYDFIRKRLSVAVRNERQRIFITKGAFRNVLEVCSYVQLKNGDIVPVSNETAREINERFIAYSQSGYRVLGLAIKLLENEKISRHDEQQMTFIGYILLEDPLKESVAASIDKLEKLHINVKIITGDNRYAALHAAQGIGMKSPVILTGEEMNKLSPEALVIRAKQADVFSEIEPHQKERIIKSLQKSHFTVAYLGDGINDVAAINAADIGISTSNAVDVAKEAADFVFLEKDLAVLADGVYEGRKSFANSMKYIFITTGATFGNMLSVACASLFLPFLPMLPKQILLTNLITDFPFLTIASDRVDDDQLTMPGQWNLKLIRNFMITYGLHSSLFDLATFYVLYFHYRLSESPFQTGWFLESVITEILIVFVVRTRKFFIKSRPGKLLVITSGIAFLAAIFLPLSPFAGVLGFSVAHARQVIAIAFLLVAYIITAEWLKQWFFARAIVGIRQSQQAG